MKNINLFLVAGVALLVVSCGNGDQNTSFSGKGVPPRDQYIAQIKKLEMEMHKSHEINNETSILAIKAYSDYAMFFPKDSLAPDCLFKAGQIATAAKKYKQALALYQSITSKYPDFKYASESLYLQGFLLDNFMNDDAGAKIIYEEIIAKYPNTTLARDSQAAINNLGKTDEQIIEEFQKKNGKK